MRIQEATENDGSRLADFLLEYWEEGNVDFPKEKGRILAHKLFTDCAELPESHAIYIAVDNLEEILGYIAVHWIPFPMIHGTECYISDLVVKDTERGRGIGTKLLAYAETEAKQRGCCRLTLNNHRHSESYRRNFYSNNGFSDRNDFVNMVRIIE